MPVILTTDEEREVWMRAVGRGEGVAAAIAGRRAQDRDARRRQGRHRERGVIPLGRVLVMGMPAFRVEPDLRKQRPYVAF
jgi:hypothetical protein